MKYSQRNRKEYFKEYNKTRPPRQRDWSDIHKKEKSNAAYHLLRCSRNRKYKYPNLENTLTIDDIIVPDICPVFGHKLSFDDKTRYGPSLDRVDNTQGYIPGNVQVISRKANLMKSDASPEELVKFAKWVLKSYNPELLSPSGKEEQ